MAFQQALKCHERLRSVEISFQQVRYSILWLECNVHVHLCKYFYSSLGYEVISSCRIFNDVRMEVIISYNKKFTFSYICLESLF